MNKELYQVAAKACYDVYEKNTDLGTTEFHYFLDIVNGKSVQVLAIAGSNELKDWFVNVNLFSWKGIKIGAYRSAKKIHKELKNILSVVDLPLIVCGHSKAGPTAIAFKRLFGAEYCIAFAPARSLRYWANRKMDNTVIFTDPDDLVSKVACISFGHPICKTIEAKSDHLLFSIDDHVMKHWIEFVNNMID